MQSELGQEALISKCNEDFSRGVSWAERRRSPSEVRTSVAKMNCLNGYPTGRGQAEGSPQADVRVFRSRVGLPSSEYTSIGFRVRGALSYGAGQVDAQLGMSLPGGQLPN